MQIVANKDSTITLTLNTATFAKVKFESPVVEKPEPANPAPVISKPAPVQKELIHAVTPSQLSGVCYAFDQGIDQQCTSCNGTGQVTVKVQTGTEQQGIYQVPRFSNEQQKCERCHGCGIDRAKDEVLIRLSGSMVHDLAGVRHDDPKTQTVMTKAYDEITSDMIGDRATWLTLTKNGRSILAQKDPIPGTTVVSLVEVKHSGKDQIGNKRYTVRVLGTDKEVYVDDPSLADELKSGKALMGGIVDKPDNNVTVLRGGFLIAPQINHDWWWWYKDQD